MIVRFFEIKVEVFAADIQRLYDKLQTLSNHFFVTPTLFAGYSRQEVNI